MPSQNTVKQFDTNTFYHVYNRGAAGQKIFMDSQDKRKFMELLRRHILDEKGNEDYRKFDVEVTAYCLMNNHFHLLLWQGEDINAITGLMRSVSTGYGMYFNRRYKRQGHVFQSIFRASPIVDESYLAHITRYIHMNPERYRNYFWSSLREYLGERSDELVRAKRVLDMTPAQYEAFLAEYADKRRELKQLYKELAG